jgi:hypothetical protein
VSEVPPLRVACPHRCPHESTSSEATATVTSSYGCGLRPVRVGRGRGRELPDGRPPVDEVLDVALEILVEVQAFTRAGLRLPLPGLAHLPNQAAVVAHIQELVDLASE